MRYINAPLFLISLFGFVSTSTALAAAELESLEAEYEIDGEFYAPEFVTDGNILFMRFITTEVLNYVPNHTVAMKPQGWDKRVDDTFCVALETIKKDCADYNMVQAEVQGSLGGNRTRFTYIKKSETGPLAEEWAYDLIKPESTGPIETIYDASFYLDGVKGKSAQKLTTPKLSFSVGNSTYRTPAAYDKTLGEILDDMLKFTGLDETEWNVVWIKREGNLDISQIGFKIIPVSGSFPEEELTK